MVEKLKEYEIAQRRAEQYKKGITSEYDIRRKGSEVTGRDIGKLERGVFVSKKYYRREGESNSDITRKKSDIPSIIRNKGKIFY